MKLCNLGNRFDYEMEKLIRLYLPFEKIEVFHEETSDQRLAVCNVIKNGNTATVSAYLRLDQITAEHSQYVTQTEKDFDRDCELALARALADCFYDITNYRPEWGILTGVRPARLFSRKVIESGKEETLKYFKNALQVSQNKIDLCVATEKSEKEIIDLSRPDSFSLYLSVPFCPTRCSYCSFVSHSVDKAGQLISPYVDHLCEELIYTAKIAKELNLRLETVYMGGGTPTTLSADQLNKVLSTVNEHFDLSNVREFTVEAGRPDTITEDKLCAIKNNGATRISINPQTLNDDILNLIGRNHTAKQTVEAFSLARQVGFNNINMDLIAGLPQDTFDSFKDTLDKIISLDPESVTIHSLSMKRASTLTKKGEFPEIDAGKTASLMVEHAKESLEKNSLFPYYMYRQSKTVGNLENVGYSKKGFEGLYNVYIMDETHTILACGASAVTKLKAPNGEEIKRIFNYKYPYEYISGFDQQLSRKSAIKEFYTKF